MTHAKNYENRLRCDKDMLKKPYSFFPERVYNACFCAFFTMTTSTRGDVISLSTWRLVFCIISIDRQL